MAKTQFTSSPVVILKAEDGRILPIYIGPAEAASIYSALNHYLPPRPMTHDLLVDIIAKLNGKVEKVVIDDLVETTFYARIVVKQDDRDIEIDARPSDSIAIALRIPCPIFVDQTVLDKAGIVDLPEGLIAFDQIY